MLTSTVVAAVPAYIVADIGGANHWVWFITANLLASAAVSPFVGSLSDLAGRRSVALFGSLWVLIGQVVCGAAQDMGTFIGKSRALAYSERGCLT